MYTAKHVAIPLLPPSCSHSSSLLPHLLHHLCSCNKQDSVCAPLRSLHFSSLSISDHRSHRAQDPVQDCLTCSSPREAPLRTRTLWVAHYASQWHSRPGPVSTTQLSSVGGRTLQSLHVVTSHALSLVCTIYTMTFNYSNNTKPSPHSAECTASDLFKKKKKKKKHTIDLNQSSL